MGTLFAALWLFAACGPATPEFEFTFAEQRARLDANGLRMVVLPDRHTDLVEVDVRYEVGSSADPVGKAGLAHLVEHLMFLQRPEGPDKPPLSFYINQITTSFNAYTNWDSTHYMMMGRKENLESMLQVEATRMFYGCRNISQEEFEREREVVRNEIRQRTGTARGQIGQLLLSAVYPQGHAYSRMIGGNDLQLAAITLADVCDFMGKYYVPANATVIVAGDTGRDEVAKLMARWFGKIPSKVAAPTPRVAPVTLSRKRVSHAVDVERPQLYVAWILPPITGEDGRVARLFVDRLAARVAHFAADWKFATDISAQTVGGQLAEVFVIAVELRDESQRGEALDFVWKAARSAGHGLKFSDLDLLKVSMRFSFVRGLEPMSRRTNLIADLVQFEPGISWNSQEQFWERRFKAIDKLDGERAAKVLKRVLDPEKAVIVDIRASARGLKGDRRAGLEFETRSHEDDWEKTAVDPRTARQPFNLPRVSDPLAGARRFTLGNGMQVVLLPSASMPIVTASLVFAAGSAHEPAKKAGLATVAADFIWRYQNPSRVENVFVAVASEANLDYTAFTAQTLDIYLEPMIKKLERTITVARYDQEAIERWQQYTRDGFKSRRYRENREFAMQQYKAIYGPEHAYTLKGAAMPSTVGRIGRDAARNFGKRHYTAKNATLVVTGKFAEDAAEKAIRKHFSRWGGGHRDRPVPAVTRARTGPEYIGVVAKKGPQMRVSITYPGPAGVDDKEAIRLILLEMLNIRMNDIREKLGATYGVYARRVTRMGPSMYEMGGAVDARRAGESLRAMRAGIDSLRTGHDDFDSDFVRARRRVIQRILGQSTVSASVADRLGIVARYNLSPGYFAGLLKDVAAASPGRVKELIFEELGAENEVVVCMADRPTLMRAFAEAGIEKSKLVEPE